MKGTNQNQDNQSHPTFDIPKRTQPSFGVSSFLFSNARIFCFFAILIISGFFIFFANTETISAAVLPGWGYKRTVSLSPATPEANYQVKITLTTANFNYAHAKSDGSDLRFYDSTETTPLSYWIETWTSGGTSTVWVKVPASGASSINMYYGNAGATAGTNGDNTFLLFDDFSGSTLDANKWTTNIPAQISFSGGWITVIGGGYVMLTSVNTVQGNNIAIESLINVTAVGLKNYQGYAQTTFNSDGVGYYGEDTSNLWDRYVVFNGSGGWRPGTDKGLTTGVTRYSTCITPSGIRLIASGARSFNDYFAGTTGAATFKNIAIFATYANFTVKSDFVFVRKYQTSEPVSTVGSEQNNPNISAPTVTTNSVSSITDTTATGNGNITATGGQNPTRSIEWGTSTGVYTTGSCSAGTGTTGLYNCPITNLSPNTTYFVRAKANNDGGTSYGSETSFKTAPAAPTNLSATDGTNSTKVVITWTKSTGATGYRLYRDNVQIGGDLGDINSYDDTGADSPTITPGTADASDQTSGSHVTLSVSGASAGTGTSHTYKITAFNTSGESPVSTTDTGYKGTTTLAYQWERSAGDSNESYSDLSGANTNPYNDTTAPSNGSGRYYQARVSMTGATTQTTNSDRGYRIASPTVTTDNVSNITSTGAQGHGTITATGGQNPTRFIQWRTTGGSYSDINNFCSSGTGTDSYACNLTNLSPDTTYYYRAKAVNLTNAPAYGDEKNFRTLEGAVIIYDPDSDKIGQAISSSYFTIEGGNASNTTQSEANTDITLINTDTNSSLTIPESTHITKTGGGSFNFSQFIVEDALNQVKSTVSESWGAIKIGIPTIGITFSNPISVSINVGAQYNGKEIEVQYQNEGGTTWTHETTCTVTEGLCTFTTTHATTFTANGDGTFSSADPVDINLAINAGIAINCDPDVTLGPIVQDGKSDLTDNSATCTIRTNNSDGYSLTLKADEPNLTSASDTLNPITASSTPTTWDGTAVPNTASGWGYRLSTLSTIDDAKWGTDDQTGVNYGTNAKWYKATASDYQIVAASSETDNDGDSEILNFGAEIGAGMIQPTGTYTTTVTLTAITL